MSAPLRETTFDVPRMDCPSEERMIRDALAGVAAVRGVACDLAARRVRVVHEGGAEAATAIEARLAPLGLGAVRRETVAAEAGAIPAPLDARREARTLKVLLAINAVMFAAELAAGIAAESTGLVADSLDMFADAAVYGLALAATAAGAAAKLRAARVAGVLQALLALGALAEVVRGFVAGAAPEPPLMMGMAGVALAANATCLWLVAKHRDGGVHMKASIIFSASDVIANLGVIAAGGLVAVTGSRYPDLVVGAIIAALVLDGARRILRLRG